jgi:hypothetical protein
MPIKPSNMNQQQYPGIRQMCKLMGAEDEADIEFSITILSGRFDQDQLHSIDAAFINNRSFFDGLGGIPFPEENDQFAKLIADDYHVELLGKAAEILNS